MGELRPFLDSGIYSNMLNQGPPEEVGNKVLEAYIELAGPQGDDRKHVEERVS